MPDTSSSQSPTPALLRFRGLDLEAMTALQMRNIDAVRRMANLMLDSTQEITERQAAFLKAGFERQTEAYRDLFGAFVTQIGELSEISSKCCAGLVHEATGNLVDLPTGENRTEPTAKRAGAASKTSPAKT